jgi:peptidoglycan hydrolase CwlO-like protein
MFDTMKQRHSHLSDRDLLITILVNQYYLTQKLENIMSAAEDLQALVAKLTASQAGLKTSLDSIKTGVATIVAGLPATGGMTADEVTALKASLSAAVDTETANAAEASDDAAAVAAAQPAAPVADPGTPAETPAV